MELQADLASDRSCEVKTAREVFLLPADVRMVQSKDVLRWLTV